MKSGASHSLITKKQEGGGGFVTAGKKILPSPSGVYGWVICTIFGGGLLVK